MAILWGNHDDQRLTQRVTSRTEKLTDHPQAARPLDKRRHHLAGGGGNEGSHREGDKGEGVDNCQGQVRYLIVTDHMRPLQAKLPGSHRG